MFRACRKTESEFKRAYAKAALAAGLTKEQIVRIYGFEAGGNGDYDVQAGLEYNKQARAITTALGYNQLLATNTVEIIAEKGSQFIKSLMARATRLPDGEKTALEGKIGVVRKMVNFSVSVTRRLEPAPNAGEYAEGARRPCDEFGRRRRTSAADPKACRFSRVRAPQGIRARR